MGCDDDGAAAVKVVVEQRVVELFAKENVEAEGWLVEHKQTGVNRHYDRKVQLRDHTLGQFPYLAFTTDGGSGQETLRFRAIEMWMDSGDVIEDLRDFDPARKD